MKYVLVIGDGMADAKLTQLDGKTPLEALKLDAFDRAAGCELGRVRTVPAGMAPGSDTAILSIFGNDPRTCYTGRSALEAAGMGIPVPSGSVSLRINLCSVEEKDRKFFILSHNGGGIHGRAAETLMRDLTALPSPFAFKMKEYKLGVHPTDTFRHVGVMEAGDFDLASLRLTEPHNILGREIGEYLPQCAADDTAARRMCKGLNELMEISYDVLKDHPINLARTEQGQLPANMIWPWGAATAMQLSNFTEKYHKTGTVVSAVPLVWGIASLAGLKTPRVKGANGELNTNYRGKVDAALNALDDGDDFAAVHIEAPDEMAHAGEMIRKMMAIQNVNDLAMRPILEELSKRGGDHRVLIMCDHPTLLTTRTHDASPVPYAIFDSRISAPPRKYSEAGAMDMPLLEDGSKLLERLFTHD
ncbi:MAG: 2,3-bisphosphoglycerate-independent phosphoglycerate mutase [Clostridiales bacterium]|nr:2,3-bisphosphoglycerate-independent phosphoglycerate mutase [Clostridiales bacterium]